MKFSKSRNQFNPRQPQLFSSLDALFLALALVGVAGQASAQTNAIAPPPSLWEASAAFGLTLTRGNSETVLVNGSLRADRKKNREEWRLGLDATYGEDSGTKNNQQVKGFSQYNHILENRDRWYLFGRIEGLHDAVADVDARFTISPGAGYLFIKKPTTKLAGELGPGVVFEKVGESDWESYFTLRAAERFEHRFNERAKMWQTAEIIPDILDTGNYIINAELGIETAINSKWSLRVVLQNSYDNEPPAGNKNNDLKLVAGISYKFKSR
jgi:putative salt-induced outer membrane protein YdiY